MKMNGSNGKMDERQGKILSEALAASAVFAYFYEIIIIVSKLINTKDIKTVYMEVGLICTMFIAMTSYYIVTNEYDGARDRIKIKKRRFPRKMDERQRKHLSEALSASAVFGYFYVMITIIFKFIGTKNIKNVYTEIVLLCIMSVVINAYHTKKKEYNLPKTFFGRILPIGNSKEDKRSRYGNYILDSLITTIIFLPINIISRRTIAPLPLLSSEVLSYVADSLARFVMFFIINYSWGEYNIKRYNNYYKSLQDGDEEDDSIV